MIAIQLWIREITDGALDTIFRLIFIKRVYQRIKSVINRFPFIGIHSMIVNTLYQRFSTWGMYTSSGT